MYQVRIEHSGYDESTLTFSSTLSLAEYLSSIARSEELNGKVLFTLKIVTEEDNNG